MGKDPKAKNEENPVAKVLHEVEDATGGRAHRQPAGEQKQSNLVSVEDPDGAERN